jgi:hypothetical protein
MEKSNLADESRDQERKIRVNRRFIPGPLWRPHIGVEGLRKRAMATNLAEVGERSQASARSDASDRDVPAQRGRSFYTLVAAIEHSEIAVANLSVAALQDVLNGVITGEGPTVAGRVHFSRTLDPADAALCARILEGAGGAAGLPVTRLEAEVLFDIDAAAAERTDNGRFGDLFVKSIAHFVLAQAGHKVPPRQIALAPETDLSSWANPSTDVDGEVLAWIASKVRYKKRLKSTLMGLSAFLACIGASVSFTAPTFVDLIA